MSQNINCGILVSIYIEDIESNKRSTHNDVNGVTKAMAEQIRYLPVKLSPTYHTPWTWERV
jgi:hypothetical protein